MLHEGLFGSTFNSAGNAGPLFLWMELSHVTSQFLDRFEGYVVEWASRRRLNERKLVSHVTTYSHYVFEFKRSNTKSITPALSSLICLEPSLAPGLVGCSLSMCLARPSWLVNLAPHSEQRKRIPARWHWSRCSESMCLFLACNKKMPEYI